MNGESYGLEEVKRVQNMQRNRKKTKSRKNTPEEAEEFRVECPYLTDLNTLSRVTTWDTDSIDGVGSSKRRTTPDYYYRFIKLVLP